MQLGFKEEGVKDSLREYVRKNSKRSKQSKDIEKSKFYPGTTLELPVL